MINIIDIAELNRNDFERADLKNDFIKCTNKEYLGFVDCTETSRDELCEVLSQTDLLSSYDVVVFGRKVPENAMDLCEILQHFDMDIFAFVFKRGMMELVGSFNEKILAGNNLEFLCRLSDEGTICFVPCVSENEEGTYTEGAEGMAETMAYMLKRNLVVLQKKQVLNDLFQKVTQYFMSKGCLEEFEQKISAFLNNDEEFKQVEVSTAPFYIITGDETCYGVLKDFALSLADSLKSLGQAVITSGNDRGNKLDITLKGIIGFQAPVLESEFFGRIKAKKFQFWFDNPIFFSNMFKCRNEDFYLLCQDKQYADHVKKYYGLANTMQFPPAGKDGNYFKAEDKIYDVVFIGTYNKFVMPDNTDSFKETFFTYMLDNPKLSFEQGLENILKGNDILQDKRRYMFLMWSLADVCRAIINFYREKVIDIILASGISVHVFGDSWKAYNGKDKAGLIMHQSLSSEEVMEVLSQSKVSLNVMSWHKSGMTERIANAMLAGAVCVSDSTIYLKENFDANEILLFELDELEKLPEKIKCILADDSYRIKMVQNAYKKAIKEHTWKKRAEDILKLVDGEEL